MKKKILIINTGGTISSVQSAQGYEPAAGYIESALQGLAVLKHPSMPNYEIQEYLPLLDSSNIGLEDWNAFAQTIWDNYDHFDGFVIYHGTDTMAYTASALSFMLENLAKPVILTGSQLPLAEVRNDAYDHVVTALWLAAYRPLQEVCIYFNQHLFRGNRTKKISADKFHAFDSPNFPPLAQLGTKIGLEETLLIKRLDAPFNIQKLSPQDIGNFRLYPGFSLAILKALLDQPIKALVLETFGTGNAASNNKNFIQLLKEATERGIIIINCTQCLQGRVEMRRYATGFALYEAGLITGLDMTAETVHTKLLYLLSKYNDMAMVKQQLTHNLCGELTP